MEMTSAIESANNSNVLSAALLNSHLNSISQPSHSSSTPIPSPQVSSKTQQENTSASAGSSPSQKRKTTRVQWACANCRKRKQGCDASRPCRRCVEKGIPCVEVDSKRKRGRAFGKTVKDDSWSPQSLSPRVGSPRISQRLSSSLDLPFDDFQSDSPEEENSSSPHPEEEHNHDECGEKCQDHIATPPQKPNRKLPIVKETVSTSSYGLRQMLASASLQQYQQNGLTHSNSLQATASNGSNGSLSHSNSYNNNNNSNINHLLASSPVLSTSSSNNHLGPTLSQSTGELTLEFSNILNFGETSTVLSKPPLASVNLSLLCPFLENILENNNNSVLGDFEPQLLSADYFDQPVLTDSLIGSDFCDLTFFNEHHVSNSHCSLSFCHKLLISKLNSPSPQQTNLLEHQYEKLNKTFPFFSSFQQQQQTTDSLKEKYNKVKEIWREIFSSLRSMEWKKVQSFLQDLDSVYSLPSDAVFQYSPAVVLWSPGGRIHHANEAFCQLLGYSVEELRVSAPNLLSPTFMYLNHNISSNGNNNNNQANNLPSNTSFVNNNSLHFNPSQSSQIFNSLYTSPFIQTNNNNTTTATTTTSSISSSPFFVLPSAQNNLNNNTTYLNDLSSTNSFASKFHVGGYTNPTTNNNLYSLNNSNLQTNSSSSSGELSIHHLFHPAELMKILQKQLDSVQNPQSSAASSFQIRTKLIAKNKREVPIQCCINNIRDPFGVPLLTSMLITSTNH